jgi:hypothetical protein
LKGEILLDAMNGREIVILELAQLQEASKQLLVSGSAQDRPRNSSHLLVTRLGCIIDQQVYDNIAQGCF